MFPQLDRTQDNEPLLYASILLASVELRLRQGRRAGDGSMQRRLEAAVDAFGDASMIQRAEDEEEDDES